MMENSDCLFCKIVKGDIPSSKIYEDDDIFAFNDINPQAPTHILICPKKHIEKIASMDLEDTALIGKVIESAKKIAEDKQIEDYRLVFNNGSGAGQEVFHIHLHLLAGRPFAWPPG